jgi:hypothetical protein
MVANANPAMRIPVFGFGFVSNILDISMGCEQQRLVQYDTVQYTIK